MNFANFFFKNDNLGLEMKVLKFLGIHPKTVIIGISFELPRMSLFFIELISKVEPVDP